MPTPSQPTILKAADGTALSSGGSINNRDFYAFGMAIHHIDSRGLPPIRQSRQHRQGNHGQVILPEFYDSRPLVVSGQMTADTHAALIENQEACRTFLNTFRRGSAAPLRLIDPMQTDRYYTCHYDGVSIFEDPEPRQKGTICNFVFNVLAEPPFSESVDLSEENYAAPAGTFRAITTGTFESDPRLILHGPATNPQIIFGDHIFKLDFNDFSTTAKGITNNSIATSFSGTAAQRAALLSPSAFGLSFAFLLSGAYTMSYALPSNKSAGTVFAVIEPRFSSPEGGGAKILFESRYDADNYIQLGYFNNGIASFSDFNRKWLYRLRAAGHDYILTTPGVQNFVTGDKITLAVDYGAAGMRIFLNGSRVSANLVTAALATNPANLYLHAFGANFTAECKLHFLSAWSSQLTENEHARIADDPVGQVVNRNLNLKWTGSLDSGDMLSWDRVGHVYVGKKFDVSANSVATVWPDDGTIIPPLSAENTAIYHPTAIDRVYIQWRNRYL